MDWKCDMNKKEKRNSNRYWKTWVYEIKKKHVTDIELHRKEIKNISNVCCEEREADKYLRMYWATKTNVI